MLLTCLLLWQSIMTKATSREKEFICTHNSRGIRVHHGTEAWQKAEGMQLEQKLRAYILTCKYKV